MITALRFASSWVLLACCACGKPHAPDKDRPPEPQAARPTQLRDWMQAPINKAKTAEPQVLEAAKRERAAIEAQASGEQSPPPDP